MIYKRIRKLRENHLLTQSQVAEAIHIPTKRYAAYENGRYPISFRAACALAKFYSVSLEYLVELTDISLPNPPPID